MYKKYFAIYVIVNSVTAATPKPNVKLGLGLCPRVNICKLYCKKIQTYITLM